jgi:hypothetical protein
VRVLFSSGAGVAVRLLLMFIAELLFFLNCVFVVGDVVCGDVDGICCSVWRCSCSRCMVLTTPFFFLFVYFFVFFSSSLLLDFRRTS